MLTESRMSSAQSKARLLLRYGKAGDTRRMKQLTPAWFAARRGKITASNVAGLLGVHPNTAPQEAYERLMGKRFAGNRATEWGRMNEEHGFTFYQRLAASHRTLHRLGRIETTGLHTHRNYDWLAGSPDGLIDDDGLLEIKCPYSGRVPKTLPIHHYIQVQMLLECTDRKWCDLLVYTLHKYAIFHIVRDKSLFQTFFPFCLRIHEATQKMHKTCPDTPEYTIRRATKASMAACTQLYKKDAFARF